MTAETARIQTPYLVEEDELDRSLRPRRLQDFVGPQASSTSSEVCPWALHTSRSTPRTSSVLPLICRSLPVALAAHADLSYRL